MVRVEHEMSEKLKEKVVLEIARVAHETQAKDSDGGYGSCRSNRRNMDFSYCLSKF
ncbi:hypothetical protein DY000_02041267 [Brassica cretica]|uniref:Uncharacterized protein n=1 Tax=Brassica cretica TaxID=69181 RepID=A0ABQ7BMD8_BRACR|nr:hypothetical protein DY000_02041267 [Brassica cretica]